MVGDRKGAAGLKVGRFAYQLFALSRRFRNWIRKGGRGGMAAKNFFHIAKKLILNSRFLRLQRYDESSRRSCS
jgi:hypothetical protein